MSVPAAATFISSGIKPRINGRAAMVVHNSEIVTTYSVASAINVQEYRLVPSFPPWLAVLAKCFSKYRWLCLRCLWIPSCPTSTSGSIHMCLRYDESDSTPTSTAQLSVMQGYTTGAIWAGSSGGGLLHSCRSPVPSDAICTTVDTKKFEKPWYRFRVASSIPSDTDVASALIPATLVVATEGGTATTPVVVGHIHWSYEIELIEPCAPALNN